MQNFREKYPYKMSLYFSLFLSLFLGATALSASFYFLEELIGVKGFYSDSDSLYTYIFWLFSAHPFFIIFLVLFIFSLRFFSLDSSKKWIDIILNTFFLFCLIISINLVSNVFCNKHLVGSGVPIDSDSFDYSTCFSIETYHFLENAFLKILSIFFIINIFLSIKYLIDLKRKNTNEVIL